MNSVTWRRVLAGAALSALIGGALFAVSLLRGEPVFRDVEPEFIPKPVSPVTPSPTGPWPKLVIESEEIQFGTVYEGDDESRGVTIRNDGEAPLQLKQGKVICDCELLGLPEKAVPPGESVELKFVWRPRPGSEMFNKSVEVFTNDPAHPQLSLQVIGNSFPRYIISPQGDWDVALINERLPTEFVGIIMSPVKEDFVVEAVDVGDAPIEVVVRPVSRESRHPLATGRPGQEIVLRIRPEMPIGPFRYPLQIRTNIPGRRPRTSDESQLPVTLSTQVTGRRAGPFRFIGKGWFEERGTMSLGTFSAAEGTMLKCLLLCEDESQPDVQFLGVEANIEPLTIDVRRDPNFKGRGAKFEVRVEFPPGGPSMRRQLESAAPVRLKFSHPTCPEIGFALDFNAT